MEQDLDDPAYAAFAWGRFRRMLAWMALLSLIAALAALAGIWWWIGGMNWVIALATIAGVGLSVLLGTALMGLVFLSNGSGHDAAVDSFNAPRDPGRDVER
ncbi:MULTISPECIES: hypothetical protein [unclassified Sphingomonas]|uniref:hypothetical protein n=1 Tax=unclassified Sphingomonas TaxID=196159 RepID=UPI0006FB99B2|nr:MULTISPECIES: hypothetical protein [unclassified Sphingomonas]KQN07567.1 hypothetical protein ASE78_00020 [Sphingomonas sp. Leaf25]